MAQAEFVLHSKTNSLRAEWALACVMSPRDLEVLIGDLEEERALLSVDGSTRSRGMVLEPGCSIYSAPALGIRSTGRLPRDGHYCSRGMYCPSHRRTDDEICAVVAICSPCVIAGPSCSSRNNTDAGVRQLPRHPDSSRRGDCSHRFDRAGDRGPGDGEDREQHVLVEPGCSPPDCPVRRLRRWRSCGPQTTSPCSLNPCHVVTYSHV
jgi:hypothetical protein